jgi:hypothetical protein
VITRIIGARASSEGIFRAGTLGCIRFFWPFNHIRLQDLLLEVVLPPLLVAPHLHPLHSLPVTLLHLLVFAPDLLSGPVGEVGLDKAKVGAVKFDELDGVEITS